MSIELIANYCFLSDFGVKRTVLILFSQLLNPYHLMRQHYKTARFKKMTT
jgi:hypothetical protein